MLNIGCHLSTSKGFEQMGKTALQIGANTFQFFSRNPRGSKAKPLDEKDLAKLQKLMQENHFVPLLAHAPYTLNMCSPHKQTYEFARMVIEDDLKRMESLPNNMYTFHPGSHGGQGLQKGIEQIVQILNELLQYDFKTTILLELMSGKGTELGKNFEELQLIIEQVKKGEKLGICLDTCHAFAGGYDLVNDLDGVLERFDKVIGLERLKAIHLNDSLTPLGSHKDRHAPIGEGEIGWPAIVNIINHPILKKLPFYLETPNELEGYAREIKMLRDAFKG